MKIKLDDDTIIIFLNKHITKDFDYSDTFNLEKELKKVFTKLSIYYGIELSGYYDIYLYIDNNFGAILECIKDSFIYDDNFLDIRLTFKYSNFLYLVDDIKDYPFMHNIYLYDGKLYLEILENIDSMTTSLIIENSDVVYKDIDKIKQGKIWR